MSMAYHPAILAYNQAHMAPQVQKDSYDQAVLDHPDHLDTSHQSVGYPVLYLGSLVSKHPMPYTSLGSQRWQSRS